MKKLVGLLALAVILAGIATLHFWKELGAQREEAGRLAARETALNSASPAPASPQLPPEPVTPALAAANPQRIPAPAAIAASPTNPQETKEAARSPAQAMIDALSTPEGLDGARAMMRGMMAQVYPDIEQELGITAQERQKLFDLVAGVDADSAELAASAPKDPAARREMQRRMVESERTRETKVSELLGNRYPKWEEYQSTAQARQQVEQLRRTLSVTEYPLSDAQTTQLVTAFAAEQKRADKETRAWSRSPAAIESPNMMQETIQRTADSQSRLVDVASPILAPAQLDRYRRQVEQQASVLRATLTMMGAGGQP